jgi:hypothetical protein
MRALMRSVAGSSSEDAFGRAWSASCRGVNKDRTNLACEFRWCAVAGRQGQQGVVDALDAQSI